MKQEWSSAWKSSTQPRKQRKYLFNLPLHLARKQLSAHLNKELQGKYHRRSFPLCKGDTVTVLRGQFKGKTGTVSRVSRVRLRVFVSGVEFIKKNGTTLMYPLASSNLMITKLHLEDKKRVAALERGKK